MMNAPNCPQHADLARDLALGRLDDDAALVAEEALTTCADCQAWWDATFDPTALGPVDAAVGSVFADVRLPVRQRRQPWLAVAAAAVLAFASSFLWLQHQGPDLGPRADLTPVQIQPAAGDPMQPVQALDFESGDVKLDGLSAPAVRIDSEPVVAAGFESGTFEVKADQVVTLSSVSFESGSLEGLIPTT